MSNQTFDILNDVVSLFSEFQPPKCGGKGCQELFDKAYAYIRQYY